MSGWICIQSGLPLVDDGAGPDGAKCAARHFHRRTDDGWGYADARPAWQAAELSLNARGGVPGARSDAAEFLSAGAINHRVIAPVERSRAAASAPGLVGRSGGEGLSAGLPDGPAESLKLFATAREIGAETATETPWIARPWLARGAITELDGRLKASGKTTWLLAMIAAVIGGAPFMGEPTIATPVVLLTEQAGPSLRDALRRAGLLDREDVVVMRWAASRGLSWELVVQAAAAKADEIGASVIAVDTLSQFTGLGGDAENDAGAALQTMQPLQVVAATGLAVIVNRHERKGGGDVGDSGRGSSAISGAVDIVLSLRKTQGQARPTIRALHALSRFDETPDELVIELVDGTYRTLGTTQDVALREARRATLAEMPTTAEDAIDAKTLLERLAEQKVKRTTLIAVLDELLADRSVIRTGAGRRGDPYRYVRASAIDSAGAAVAPAASIDDAPTCTTCGLMVVAAEGEECQYCAEGQ